MPAQAPGVYTYAYPIGFDLACECFCVALPDTFEIEDIFPMSLPVYPRELLRADVELRTDLLHHAVKDAGVDGHEVQHGVAYRNDVKALLQKRSLPFFRRFISFFTQLHLRLAFELSVQVHEIAQNEGMNLFVSLFISDTFSAGLTSPSTARCS